MLLEAYLNNYYQSKPKAKDLWFYYSSNLEQPQFSVFSNYTGQVPIDTDDLIEAVNKGSITPEEKEEILRIEEKSRMRRQRENKALSKLKAMGVQEGSEFESNNGVYIIANGSIILKKCLVTTGEFTIASFANGMVRSGMCLRSPFADCEDIKVISKGDNIISLESAFEYCEKLKKVDLTEFNTSEVVTMFNLFRNCENLTEVKLNGINTSNLKDARAVFRGCESLESIDISELDLSNVRSMSEMFFGCFNLKKIHMKDKVNDKVEDVRGILHSCERIWDFDITRYVDSTKVKRWI